MATKNNDENTAPNRVKNINDPFVQNQTNGNQPDSSAKRNIGPNGETERRGQKDKLENMHIGGNETTGYGANDPDSIDYLAQGPGFEMEGSYELDEGNQEGIRSKEQLFGEPYPDKDPDQPEEGYPTR